MRIGRGLAIACALALASCATCAGHQVLAVRSDPEAAQIFVDGELVGETPARLALRRELDHVVFLKKEGYRPELALVHTNRSPDGLAYLTPWEIDVRLLALDDPAARDLEIQTED
jgi:hypothetical protein